MGGSGKNQRTPAGRRTMTMPASVAKDPIKRREWILRYCGNEDEQSFLMVFEEAPPQSKAGEP